MELLTAHSSPVPVPGKHYWLTCPLDTLFAACAARDFASISPPHSHFTPLDALLAAAERGASTAVAAYLAAHADTSAAELGAALLQAAAFGRADVVAELLRDPASSRCPVSPTDAGGATPLHRAADGGHAAVLQLLLDRAHPVDCRDALGRTALLLAVDGGAPEECVVALMRAGADATAPDDRARTPAGLAEAQLLGAKPAAARGAAVASRRAVAGFARLQRLVGLLTAPDVLAGAPQLPPPQWSSGTPAGGDTGGALLAGGAGGGAMLPQRHRSAGRTDASGGDAAAAAGSGPIGDLPTLLVMLLAKFKASVDQGIFGSYGDIYGLLTPAGAPACRAEDVASGCAEMGIPVSPALLPALMERMARRRGADSLSREEFVSFWEHLSRSAGGAGQ